MMISAVSFYVHCRAFSCDVAAPAGSAQLPFHYEFNPAEKVGNALITPIEWVAATFWDHTDLIECRWQSYVIRAALLIVGIFAIVLGIVGYAVKQTGELVNPNAPFRQQALEEYSKITLKLGQYFDQQGKHLYPNEDNKSILTSIPQAINSVLLGKSVNYSNSFNDHILYGKTDEQKQILTQQWQTILQEVSSKLSQGNLDVDAQQAALVNLTAEHLPTQTLTLQYLNDCIALIPITFTLAQQGLQFANPPQLP